MPVLTERRTAGYKPALAWFSAVGGFWVAVLVMLGAFTTSIGAGMIFPDWPLSNGSLNPEGWLTEIAKFAEHSHRLSAGLMAMITAVIAAWIFAREARPAVRKLALAALGLVFLQALVGGLRVLLDPQHLDLLNTSVGRLFAMLHACLAQIYVCLLLAVVLTQSRAWFHGGAPVHPPGWRGLADLCVILLLVQLAVAAVMRHSFAGLAIPTFPASNANGGWLPLEWDFRVGIHFAHRVMAVVLFAALVTLALKIIRDPAAASGTKQAAAIMAGLLGLQIALGGAAVLTYRNQYYTTAHVLNGAALLAVTFGLACWSRRACAAPPPRKDDDAHLSLRRA